MKKPYFEFLVRINNMSHFWFHSTLVITFLTITFFLDGDTPLIFFGVPWLMVMNSSLISHDYAALGHQHPLHFHKVSQHFEGPLHRLRDYTVVLVCLTWRLLKSFVKIDYFVNCNESIGYSFLAAVGLLLWGQVTQVRFSSISRLVLSSDPSSCCTYINCSASININ